MTTIPRRWARAAALVALCAGAPLSAASPDLPPAATSSQLAVAVSALRGIGSLRANFSQIDSTGQSVTGVLTLKRPGKFRFQYAPGYPMLVLSDGHALTVIDFQVKEVQHLPIGRSPIGALLDPNRDISRYGRLLPGTDPHLLSVELRDQHHREFGVMTLFLIHKPSAPGGWELGGWETVDSQNKRTTIRLSNQEYGLDVPDSLFQWKEIRNQLHSQK